MDRLRAIAARCFWLPGTPSDELFTVDQTALALGVGRNKLHTLGIPTRMAGRQKCYRKGDVIAFLEVPGNRRSWIEAKQAGEAAWMRRHGSEWRKRRERYERWRHGPLSSPGLGPDWDAAERTAQEKAEEDLAKAMQTQPNLTLRQEIDLLYTARSRHFRAEIERSGLLSGTARRRGSK